MTLALTLISLALVAVVALSPYLLRLLAAAAMTQADVVEAAREEYRRQWARHHAALLEHRGPDDRATEAV